LLSYTGVRRTLNPPLGFFINIITH